MKTSGYQIHPIGHVNAKKMEFSLEIDTPFRKGLKMLDQFSHILVVWWAAEQDTARKRETLLVSLPYAPLVEAGVFACRSESRPNPVALTVCACLEMDMERGLIRVPYMDAFDKTPIIDIKPYFPVSDRVREVRVAPWAENWPGYFEEAYKMEEIFSKFEPCR
jgi:tRNA-Thr(GGU) m(6)t(6)A37 methyltransferase TsaA